MSRCYPSGPMLRALAVLLVAAFGLFLAALGRPSWQFDVGAAGDERFLQGFYDREAGDNATFRWSQPGSRLMLHGAGSQPELLVLRLSAGLGPVQLRLQANGETVGTLEVDRLWHSYTLALPARDDWLSSLEPLDLELVCDQYHTGHDGRSLGVKLGRVRLKPDPARPRWWIGSLARGAALTWALAALAGVLARLDRWLFHRRPGASWRVLPVVAAIGLLLALAAHRDPYWLAWSLPFMPVILTLLSAALLLPIRPRPGDLEPRPPNLDPPTLAGASTWILLAMVVLAALGMRFYQVRELPWAMWRDEARHAMVALDMLRDSQYRPIYVPSVQLPALGLYPFTIGLHLWGIHPWSLRPVTALAGALTTLPLYAVARRLTRSVHAALLAGFFLAVSSWHVTISRLSFPTVFDPLLTLTGLWMLLRGRETTSAAARHAWLAGAGLCAGLALQTYHTGLIAPLVTALLLFLVPKPEGWLTRALVPLALALGVCAAPLLVFAWDHPKDFNRRLSQVSLLARAQESGSAPLAALDASVGRHLLMFNVRGDHNGRHHAPERPLLDVVTGIGFLVGLVVLLRRREQWESRFVLSALALGVLPSVLAVDGPHAMRSIHAAAFACLLAALGWLELARRASLPKAVVLAPAVLALGLDVRTYFVAMPVDPRVWQAFYPVQTQIGVFVRDLAERRHATDLGDVFVADSVASSDVFTYLTYGLTSQTFAEGELSRPAEAGALFVLSGYSYEAQARALASYLGDEPSPLLLGPPFPGLATPSFVVYERRAAVR